MAAIEVVQVVRPCMYEFMRLVSRTPITKSANEYVSDRIPNRARVLARVPGKANTLQSSPFVSLSF